jgi:signal transduction histidine kinase/ActR/RegA family two-component response regulator
MTDASGPRVFALRGLAGYALIGGLLSLLGWAFDIPRLTDWDHDGISIQPNAALAVLLSGAALLCLAVGRRRLAAALGFLVALIGASSLLQFVFGIDLPSLNTVLMFDRTWGRIGVVSPGRMGPPGAACWTLIGAALCLASARPGSSHRRAAPLLAVLAFGMVTLSITGYLYGSGSLYSLPLLTIIALQTATFIAAVAAGIVAAVPEHRPMRWLLARGATGDVARRAVPVVLLLPILLGWLALQGELRGYYDSRFEIAVLVLALIGVLLGMLWRGLTAISRHETALRRSERALREADRRKSEFLAILAHELRNPLAPIRNAVEILRRSNDDGATVRSTSEMLERQIDHMVRLVDDLLDLSRITRGQIEIRRQRVDLSSIPNQGVEGSRFMVESMGHRLDVTLPPEPISLDADPARLTQVLGNLIQNACKFMPRGGRVTLTAGREGEHAVLRVGDEGVGIASDQLPRVFEMFTQVAAPEDRSAGGLGIGLTLVRSLVELHGGTVEARSDGLGRGSEFVVRLPLAQAAAEASRPRTELPVTAARRILVVDDNEDGARSLAMLLEMGGHSTRMAHDGLEAVHAAEIYRPDVVLLDIGLPKLDGYEACRRIRALPRGRDIALVAVTGWGQEEDHRKSREAGFDHHLVKPLRYEVLAEFLATFAEKSGVRAEPDSQPPATTAPL